MNINRTKEGHGERSSRAARFGTSPFRKIEQLADELGNCFEVLSRHPQPAHDEIIALSRKACLLYREHSDACLASVHFLGSRPHTTLHPIFSLFLAELIADAFNFSADQHELICSAALTANLGMFEHHDHWAARQGPLNKRQQQLCKLHPIKSVERLIAAGIDDRDWLDIVLHHHELVDGSGYPKGLPGKDIRRESLILSVVDRYLAFAMPRLPRERVHPTIALKHIYEHTGTYDESVIAGFVKQLGIYPPGTSVRLLNGDIAVVTHRRIGDSVHPRVVSVGDAADKRYDKPVPRDTKLNEFEIKDHLYTDGQENTVSPALISKYWSDDED